MNRLRRMKTMTQKRWSHQVGQNHCSRMSSHWKRQRVKRSWPKKTHPLRCFPLPLSEKQHPFQLQTTDEIRR